MHSMLNRYEVLSPTNNLFGFWLTDNCLLVSLHTLPLLYIINLLYSHWHKAVLNLETWADTTKPHAGSVGLTRIICTSTITSIHHTLGYLRSGWQLLGSTQWANGAPGSPPLPRVTSQFREPQVTSLVVAPHGRRWTERRAPGNNGNRPRPHRNSAHLTLWRPWRHL